MKKALLTAASICAVMAFPGMAMANEGLITIGNVAGNAASGNNEIRDSFLSFMTVAAIFLIGLSFFFFYNESKMPNQGNMKKGAFALIIGMGLLAMDFIAGAGKNTITQGKSSFSNGDNVFKGDISGNVFE